MIRQACSEQLCNIHIVGKGFLHADEMKKTGYRGTRNSSPKFGCIGECSLAELSAYHVLRQTHP